MAQCGEGNRAAVRALWLRHAGAVLGYSVKLLGDREAAEDARQATFTTLWRLATTYEPRGRFRAFLFKIAYHETRAVMRSRRSFWSRCFSSNGGDDDCDDARFEPVAPGGTDDGLLAADRERALRNAIKRLPQKQQEAIVLRYYGDLSYEELGAATGQPATTARSLVHRAQKQLAKLLPKLAPEMIP